MRWDAQVCNTCDRSRATDPSASIMSSSFCSSRAEAACLRPWEVRYRQVWAAHQVKVLSFDVSYPVIGIISLFSIFIFCIFVFSNIERNTKIVYDDASILLIIKHKDHKLCTCFTKKTKVNQMVKGSLLYKL